MTKPIAVVIVPVDHSPASRAGVVHGALLAHLLDARLELLHVVPLHPAELSDLPAKIFLAPLLFQCSGSIGIKIVHTEVVPSGQDLG